MAKIKLRRTRSGELVDPDAYCFRCGSEKIPYYYRRSPRCLGHIGVKMVCGRFCGSRGQRNYRRRT